LREAGWELYGQALREGSDQKVWQAMEKPKLVDAASKRIIDSDDK